MSFTICPSFSISCFPVEEARDFCCSAASSLISKVLYAIFIFVFAVVGATLGAITGALVGAKTKTGLMHGVAVGSIKGSFLCIKLLEISLTICSSNDLALATRYRHLLQPDSMEKIPKMRITEENLWGRGSFRSRNPCSICLEDFFAWETVHSLPKCQHMFHVSCLQKWGRRRTSCPLCRRDFLTT
ncbi:hypothetical protein GQ457_13G019430 [Hibiscus cannabinus]